MNGCEGDGVSQIVLEGVGAPAEAKFDDRGVGLSFIQEDTSTYSNRVRCPSLDIQGVGDVVYFACSGLQGTGNVVIGYEVSGCRIAINSKSGLGG